MCHLPVHMLDEGCIDQFMRYHLPRCDCLGGALRTPKELHAALIPVLEILRAEGIIARAPAPTGPIADELSRYDAHMYSARGLAAGTRPRRLRIVERLLLSKFAGRPVIVSSLQPEDVRQFIVETSRTRQRKQRHHRRYGAVLDRERPSHRADRVGGVLNMGRLGESNFHRRTLGGRS